MRVLFALFTTLLASPCQAYIIPRFDLYLGIGAGGERDASLTDIDKNAVAFDMGICFGVYRGQKRSLLTGLFTVNSQIRVNQDFTLWENYATSALGARTKVGYFSVDLFGIGLSINRIKQSKSSGWDGITLPKKNGPDRSVNLGLLLVLPGGFQYDGGKDNFFTLGIRFMLNLKLYDGVAQTALEAGARTYRDVLWKVSLRVSITVGVNFMYFISE